MSHWSQTKFNKIWGQMSFWSKKLVKPNSKWGRLSFSENKFLVKRYIGVFLVGIFRKSPYLREHIKPNIPIPILSSHQAKLWCMLGLFLAHPRKKILLAQISWEYILIYPMVSDWAVHWRVSSKMLFSLLLLLPLVSSLSISVSQSKSDAKPLLGPYPN